MTNTLVVKEDRKTIDKFRDWYKEKFIDTGKSQDLEAKIEKKAEMEKKVIKIAGAVATIVLIFCPADGPVGEVCTVLATPLIAKLVDIKTEMKKNAIIQNKRTFEAKIIKADGTNKDVKIPEFNLKDLESNVKTVVDGIKEFEGMTRSK